MTVGELKEYLDDIDDDTPIKLALQPNYPMIGSLLNVCRQNNAEGDCENVWFACSGNQDYGCPHEVWEDSEMWSEDDDE